jgi:hypothetical protein
MNLFLQDSQPDMLSSNFAVFMVVHLLTDKIFGFASAFYIMAILISSRHFDFWSKAHPCFEKYTILASFRTI